MNTDKATTRCSKSLLPTWKHLMWRRSILCWRQLFANNRPGFNKRAFAALVSTGVIVFLIHSTLPVSAQQVPQLGAENIPMPQVVMLQDGRILPGIVSEVIGGYRIETAGTYIVIPHEQVRLTASSIAEAYEKLRDSIRSPRVEDHLILAEWCYQNNLGEQAYAEIDQALRLEPLRTDSRELLRKIDARFQAHAHRRTEETVVTASAAMSADAMLLSQETNESGLSRSTQQEFARRIMPLFMNKCGNARCHGEASPNEFRLSNVRSGTSGARTSLARNLEAIFEQIDFESPDRSPLLVKPGEPTDVHQRLFLGQRQAVQYQMLQEWVHQVAREKGPSMPQQSPAKVVTASAGQSSRTAITPSSDVHEPRPTEPAGFEPVKSASPLKVSHPQTQITQQRSSRTSLLDRIRYEQQPDAFDPDAFNRLVHGVSVMNQQQEKAEQSSSSEAEAQLSFPTGGSR